MSTHWRELVADKRRRQNESIPKEWLITTPPQSLLDVTKVPEQCGLLSAKELDITNTVDVAVLLNKLATSQWSAVEVTTAFCKRAIIAHQLVNCLTEIFVDRALARAAELDEHLKTTGKVVGPLHGLPISLKDQLPIKGLETTMGYVSWIGKYATRDAVLVEILYDLGAVPFVRTNVPQTLMWGETYNNVYGRTLNPHNRTLTCGGSSGGEGALVAMKGSPLGVGSDIGGSIRIPSYMCGTYGFRPSYGRIPYAGAVNSMEGQDSVLSVLGPLSNSLSGIKTFMQAVISAEPWLKDSLARRKKWDNDEYALVEHGSGKQLCFAIMWNDGQVIPHPPIIRALEMTKAALLAAGHKVIDWQPLQHRELCRLVYLIWTSGSGEDYKAVTAATGEPVLTSMDIVDENSEPTGTLNTFLPEQQHVSAYQLWQVQKEKTALRQKHLEHWNSTVQSTGTGRPVDAIIAPVAPYTAVPHGMNKNRRMTSSTKGMRIPMSYVIALSSIRFREFIRKANTASFYLPDDPATFSDAPVGLQLVGRSQEEEAVLAMTEIVDSALSQYKTSTSASRL
ncbi:hypothetical protein PHLCEN_2v400 [Hermanssonia centrifuga]|uniref:amidase n=1 Tax=Hermanssonia centrifuga TaxID=98765 RepID=A0A2R6S5Z5_9APHY|nr:hypothetical protein PHLCEN_2v400 [Hermanssonia centrifuga]